MCFGSHCHSNGELAMRSQERSFHVLAKTFPTLLESIVKDFQALKLNLLFKRAVEFVNISILLPVLLVFNY